ncbi:hypothetical protein HZS_2040 [Henneguya salminicola]|nr:hypothetical protein HZS_2040 [Henneguya salminicola]
MVGFNTTKILEIDPQNIIYARRAAHINVWRELSLMENKGLKKAPIPDKKNRNTPTNSRKIN